MITVFSKQTTAIAMKRIFETLEKIGEGGKAATRFALKEVRETYNSMTPDARDLMHSERPEEVREKTYLKYHAYFRGGV